MCTTEQTTRVSAELTLQRHRHHRKDNEGSRAQELCERAGDADLSVPNKPSGFCGRCAASLNQQREDIDNICRTDTDHICSKDLQNIFIRTSVGRKTTASIGQTLRISVGTKIKASIGQTLRTSEEIEMAMRSESNLEYPQNSEDIHRTVRISTEQ